MSVKQHEAGTYKCIVSNVHGTIVREFKLVPLSKCTKDLFIFIYTYFI